MILNSNYRPLAGITFPQYAARQMRYHTFDLANIQMAEGFEGYLDITRTLCDRAGAHKGEAYLTVDEKVVECGRSQRRPKPHVDGRFELNDWSHDEPRPTPPTPQWAHTCNNIRSAARWGHWNHGGVPLRMSVIVAASVEGCRAWRGEFRGQPASDGDLTHINDQLGEGEVLPANVGYLLSPDCVHESMIFQQSRQRSFLRIALPLDYRYRSMP